MSKKEEFLKAFQEAGIVQFVGTKVSVSDLLSHEFQEAVQALKILHHYEIEQTPNVVITDPISFSRMIIADKLRVDELRTQLKALKEKHELICPLGKIPLDLMRSIESCTTARFRLFLASKVKHAITLSPHLVPITSSQTADYFFSFTTEKIDVNGIHEIPVSEEASHIADKINQYEQELEDLEQGFKRRAKLAEGLKKALILHLNKTKRSRVSGHTQEVLQDRLFTINGWAPETRMQEVEKLASSLDVFSDELTLQEGEVPPTYLENEKMGRVGEDLVHIYDTPSCADKDPSTWVLVFFSLFFAMIVGDGGYGLLFLLTALILRKKAQQQTPFFKRFVKLVGVLGVSCVLWGIGTNSFFAMDLSPANPLRKFSPLNYLIETKATYHFSKADSELQKWHTLHGSAPKTMEEFLYEAPAPNYAPFYKRYSDNTMLELSLMVGSIHIILSIVRYLGRNIGNAGWLLFIVGSYLYVVNYLHVTSIVHYLFGIDPEIGANIGLQLLGSGLAFSVVTSIIKCGFTGIFEAMTAVQIFSDVLSYLRLYALGLSGAIVGSVINEMADKVPFMVAVVLLVLSHAVNIAMAVMGGVIHGLRLNFLEWYHYSFEGGGKEFYPLKIETYKP
jgi:V/A-type H+-transporting ATPase subunit I